MSFQTNPFAYIYLQFLWVDCIAVRPSFFNVCLVLWAEFHRFRSRLQPFFSFLLILVWLGLVIAAPAPFQNFLLFVLFCAFVFCLCDCKMPYSNGSKGSSRPKLESTTFVALSNSVGWSLRRLRVWLKFSLHSSSSFTLSAIL